MNGANLTRDDAQTRGENITVDSYAVTLDLTTGGPDAEDAEFSRAG